MAAYPTTVEDAQPIRIECKQVGPVTTTGLGYVLSTNLVIAQSALTKGQPAPNFYGYIIRKDVIYGLTLVPESQDDANAFCLGTEESITMAELSTAHYVAPTGAAAPLAAAKAAAEDAEAKPDHIYFGELVKKAGELMRGNPRVFGYWVRRLTMNHRQNTTLTVTMRNGRISGQALLLCACLASGNLTKPCEETMMDLYEAEALMEQTISAKRAKAAANDPEVVAKAIAEYLAQHQAAVSGTTDAPTGVTGAPMRAVLRRSREVQ